MFIFKFCSIQNRWFISFQQLCVVSDNVNLNIDGVLYLRINDPYLASYGVEDPEFAITQLAQTTMRYI